MFMTNKELKNKILNYYDKKEEKIFAGSIIDKINNFYSCNHLVYTNFLDINEEKIAVSILNKYKINYNIFKPIEDSSKSAILFMPDYLINENIEVIYSKYFSVIKIIPKVKGLLKHRQYMGAIYSLGLKEDMIGDIFVQDDFAYLVTFKSNLEFVITNLKNVGKSEVKLEELDVNSYEIKKLRIRYENTNVIVASNRIDVILSEVYSLSRNETKAKIQNGDLYINSKEIYFAPYNVEEGDIVSFSKCGKFKVCKILGTTKSGKIVLNIQKYS